MSVTVVLYGNCSIVFLLLTTGGCSNCHEVRLVLGISMTGFLFGTSPV